MLHDDDDDDKVHAMVIFHKRRQWTSIQ